MKSTHVGPGSYETSTISPLYNYKPSSNFASKTMRTMDQRKGAITNANMMHANTNVDFKTKPIKEEKYENQAESRMLSEKGPASTHIDSDEES